MTTVTDTHATNAASAVCSFADVFSSSEIVAPFSDSDIPCMVFRSVFQECDPCEDICNSNKLLLSTNNEDSVFSSAISSFHHNNHHDLKDNLELKRNFSDIYLDFQSLNLNESIASNGTTTATTTTNNAFNFLTQHQDCPADQLVVGGGGSGNGGLITTTASSTPIHHHHSFHSQQQQQSPPPNQLFSASPLKNTTSSTEAHSLLNHHHNALKSNGNSLLLNANHQQQNNNNNNNNNCLNFPRSNAFCYNSTSSLLPPPFLGQKRPITRFVSNNEPYNNNNNNNNCLTNNYSPPPPPPTNSLPLTPTQPQLLPFSQLSSSSSTTTSPNNKQNFFSNQSTTMPKSSLSLLDENWDTFNYRLNDFNNKKSSLTFGFKQSLSLFSDDEQQQQQHNNNHFDKDFFLSSHRVNGSSASATPTSVPASRWKHQIIQKRSPFNLLEKSPSLATAASPSTNIGNNRLNGAGNSNDFLFDISSSTLRSSNHLLRTASIGGGGGASSAAAAASSLSTIPSTTAATTTPTTMGNINSTTANYRFRLSASPQNNERYSRKVFVGGLPPDIDAEEIKAAFRSFGSLIVDWPHKADSKAFFPPKGYCFLLFQEEISVQALIHSCVMDDGKYYWIVSSPTVKEKMVQIRPWSVIDSDYVLDSSQPLDPRKTIFVGGVPRPLRACELAHIMNRLYGGVCYAGIDIDPELKYPKGAGRVTFANHQSYIAAISARFVQLQHKDIDKRVEVKPYVQDDQLCDQCAGTKCDGKSAPYFCSNVICLKYYCEFCWAQIHSYAGLEFHKPLVKEGSDRPRTVPFRW